MLIKALLAHILFSMNKAQGDVINSSAKEASLTQLKERIRKEFLVHFLQTYTEELKYNLEEYVKKLGEITAEAEIPLHKKQELDFKFSKMMYNFMEIFEKRVKDSPIIERYSTLSNYYTGKPAQQFPVMAWINKDISKPAKTQPSFLIKEDLDIIINDVLKVYDSIELENL